MIARVRPWVLVLVLATTSVAHAQIGGDALDVRTVELGMWPRAVAALQTDVHSEGRTVHVEVTSHGALLPCSAYELGLDPAGARAFELGRCDPATSATALRVVERAE